MSDRAREEPVQRYLEHALGPEPWPPARVRLTMHGRIKVGRWLPFSATQTLDGHAFEWRAHVGWPPLTPLTVIDGFEDGAGATEGRLAGRLRLFRADGTDVSRSAAGRAALESVWAPARLAAPDVRWRAESDDHIVARFPAPPEEPELHLRIAPTGALVSACAERWGDVGRDGFGYIPCGCDVHAERSFSGGVTVPSRVSVGWWFGTPRYTPFFEAEVTALERADEIGE